MKTTVTKDLANKRVIFERDFNAPLNVVWKAWSEPEILDQWWAPIPWKTETKSMDFREGGFWLYSMNGPEGEKHWCKSEYSKVKAPDGFSSTGGFCDEKGNTNSEIPEMHWMVKFIDQGESTKVHVDVSFASLADLEKIVEMGFEEGFTAAHGNLDEVLKTLIVNNI